MVATVRIVLGLGAAAVAQSVLRKLLRRWTNRKNFGGLESLVSFSSRLIAAARAVESLRPDAFVVDPLAHILAGPKAMARHRDNQAGVNNISQSGQALQPAPNKQQQQQQQQQSTLPQQQQGQQVAQHEQQHEADNPHHHHQQQQQQRQVPRLIMRTCFFDDAALAAVGAAPQRAVPCLQPLLRHVAEQRLPACKQVVLLGSGMDTRPWRLNLPPGIAWFEVDRHDVLAAKRAELSRSGVGFTPAAAAAAVPGSSSSSAEATGFQLRAASWSCAAVDLQAAGWTAELCAAGLDPGLPTAWLAEGLLYYLEPSCVGAMLQEAASISAPGSIFAGNFLTAEGLGLLHSRSASTAAAAAAAAAAAPTAAAGTGPGDSPSVPGSTSTAVDNPPTSSHSAAASSSSRPRASGLMSQFKWGCPDNVEQFFAEQGWCMLVRHSWRQAAGKYKWQPQVAAGSEGKSASQEVQFSVSVVAK